MTEMMPAERPPASILRTALIGLSAVGALGAAADLAIARHWQTPVQYIPWITLIVIGVGITFLAARPSPLTIKAVRVIALVVAAASAFGVYEHVDANYAAGPLDAVYGETWDSLSPLTQWWTAATQGVGPAPTLAPGVLAYAALSLFLATLRHPANNTSRSSGTSPRRASTDDVTS
jgi:hypothetical protein